ncbi:hypothetical protein [Paraburkholderia sp. RL17-381-BIF-C]|uniref:hypothetical protein n=1 Tax=Paraburkholderia sp. RL17-381-BIF-C TaxID=3031635 RepID=UPI0038BA61C6
MYTFQGIADDLAAFVEFLTEKGLDYTVFPEDQRLRPTYKFRGYLRAKIRDGYIAASTARRRMGSVIAFYRWLQEAGMLTFDHNPWVEHDVHITVKDARGATSLRKRKATDLSIPVPDRSDPFQPEIDDGGRLRPLSTEEQGWVISALSRLGNIEMTLIHLFMLTTGARIQTALTMRVRHFRSETPRSVTHIRTKIGPGTGIDTKNDRPMTLHVPCDVYTKLHNYIKSQRAISRRQRGREEDQSDPYVFVTQQGTPYYESKSAFSRYDSSFDRRHRKRGQTVRMFIRDHVLPHIHDHFSEQFHYRVHDLRASYGMNMSDHLMALVQDGKITLSRARAILAGRMGHVNTETTDLYLQYRQDREAILTAVDAHEDYIRNLIQCAWEGTLDE